MSEKIAEFPNLSCPHCGESVYGLFGSKDEKASLLLAKDRAHMTEVLSGRLDMTEDGILKRSQTE